MPDSARDLPYVARDERLAPLARSSVEPARDDIPWKKDSRARLFFPESFLAMLGATPPEDEEAAELLHWTLALALCRELVSAKTALLAFVEREQSVLAAPDWLAARGRATLELFEKLGARLEEGADGRIEAFSRCYRPSAPEPDFLTAPESFPHAAALHYNFWLRTLFVAEYAGLVAAQLASAPHLGKVWLAANEAAGAHAARLIEAAQAYLSCLNLSEDDKVHWSRAFYFHLAQNGTRLLGVDAAQQVLETRHPELTVFPRVEFKDLPFVQTLCEDRAFAGTRAAAPYLLELAAEHALLPERQPATPLSGATLDSRKEQSLVDLLVKATKGSGKILLHGEEEESLTAKGLLRDAEHHLLILRRLGLGPGEPVLLQLEKPKAFLTAFWGCLLGGYVAVPLPAPRNLAELPDDLDHIAAVAALLGHPPLVTDAHTARGCRAHPLGRSLTVLSWDELEAEGRSKHRPRTSPGKGSQDALIRVSRGRTGAPHAAVLSHHTVINQLAALRQGLDLGEKDVFLCGFDLASAEGLFEFHLLPLAINATQCFAKPKDPHAWLMRAKKQRATVVGCPAEQFPTTEPKALKRVTRIQCGPGRPGSELEALLDGRRYELYGLAEAGYAVTLEEQPGLLTVDAFSLGAPSGLVQVDASAPRALALHSKGKPLPGVELRVVDGEGNALPELSVGEVQVRGAGLASRTVPEQPDTRRGRWLATGDLGTLAGGRLFLAGAQRDTVFVGGRNFLARDLEVQGEGIEGLERSVVINARDPLTGHDQVVVFAALVPELPVAAQSEVLRQLATAVSERVAFPVDEVLPVRAAQLPHGRRGEVLRWRLRERYNLGEFARLSGLLPLAERAAAARRADRRSPLPRLLPLPAKKRRYERRRADRRKGARREVDRRRLAAAHTLSHDLLEAVRRLWAEVLGKDLGELGFDSNFMEIGGNALKAGQLHSRVEETFGARLDRRDLESCRTVREMAAFLHRTFAAPAAPRLPRATNEKPPIAVISIAGRLPGARDIWELWRLLKGGRSAIVPVPESRWSADDFYDPSPLTPGKTSCRWGAFVSGIEDFDPGHFDVSFESARHMDPQQRLFLEVAYDALRKGGLHRPGFSPEVGVFVGVGPSEYFHHYLERNEAEALADTPAFSGLAPEIQAELLRQLPRGARIRPQTAPGNLESMVAQRVSQVLGLRGPSLALNTAGSSALLALHLACEALQRGECSMAIAGGVSVNLTASPYLLYSQAGLLSSSGQYRPYTPDGDGLVPGEGAGALLLKPLDRALADGDSVWGIVRGSAVSHDGRTGSGAHPNLAGLEDAVRKALAQARIEPRLVSYVEGHGSGHWEADQTEVHALRRVLSEGSWEAGSCSFGCVKPNVGHLMAASGIAGVLKVLLGMHFREIPRTLHLAAPRGEKGSPAARALGLLDSPLSLAERHRSWSARDGRRIAGVTSVGVGGLSCHVLLEAPTRVQITHPAPQLICLQAKSLDYLGRTAQALRKQVRRRKLPFGLLCANLNRAPGRTGVRRAMLCRDVGSLEAQLEQAVDHATDPGAAPRVVLVLGGRGRSLAGAAHLFNREAAFREALEHCFAALDYSGDIQRLLRAAEAAEQAEAREARAAEAPAAEASAEDASEASAEAPAEAVSEDAPAEAEEAAAGEASDAVPATADAGSNGAGGAGADVEEAEPEPAPEADEADDATEPSADAASEEVPEVPFSTTVLRFAFEYAVARLLWHWGVRWDGVLGCGRGEWLAAVLTGLWPLETALDLVHSLEPERKEGISRLRVGGARARVEAVLAEAEGDVQVSAVVGPEQLEIGGAPDDLEALRARLAEAGLEVGAPRAARRWSLRARRGLVSRLQLAEAASGSLRRPVYSTVRGRKLRAAELDDDYWSAQMSQPIRLHDALAAARADGAGLFLDIGLDPHWRPALSDHIPCFAPLNGAGQGREALLATVGRLFESGLPIDGGRLSGPTPLAAPLPGPPYSRVRCWLFDQPGRERPPQRSLHPLVNEQVTATDNEVVFIKRFNAEQEYYLRDHSLHGRAFMPTAAFIEMVLGAARLTGEAHGLRNMSIVRPLFAGLTHDSKVHVHIVRSTGERRFSVVSQTAGGDTWMEHFSGQVTEADQDEIVPPLPLDVRAVRERCKEEVAIPTLYRSLEAGGLLLGPSMQCLETLHRNEREVFASLRLPDNAPDSPGYHLHPALLDAALLAICGLTFDRMPPGVVLLGFGIGEMLAHEKLRGPCLVHVEQKSEFTGGSEVIRCDVSVVNGSGRRLVELSEVCLKRSKRSKTAIGARLFEISWQESPIGLPVEHAHPVLLFADPGGIWAELKWPLRLAGTRVVVAYPDTTFEHLGDGQYKLKLDEPDHYDKLFAALKESGVAIRSVWHLAYFPAREGHDRYGQVRDLSTLCAALRRNGHRQVELNVLNSRSVPVAGSVDPYRAAVWGYLRYLASKPNLWSCRGLDLQADLSASDLARLILAEWSSSGKELLVCYARGKRYVPALQPKVHAPDPEPALRERGTYWITSGPGGLTDVLARHLARNFAARVLFTRGTPLSPEEEELCLELKSLGGDALFVQADITEREQLADALHRAETRWGSVSGVFHSAEIKGGSSKSWAGLHAQLEAKIGSAESLADLFRNRDIDFLCLFSSVLSLVGLQGSSAHAIADSFLNAFARAEHEHGRPVLASVWSDWEGGRPLSGHDVSRKRVRGNVSEFGFVPIAHDAGLEALETLLGLGHPHTLAVCVPEGRIAQLQAAFRQAHFAPQAVLPTPRPAPAPIEAPPERKARAQASWSLERTILQLVGSKLQRPSRDIDPEALFVELGLDSLSALDIVAELEKRLAVTLYPTLLFEHHTPRDLAIALDELRQDKKAARKKTVSGDAWLHGRLSKRQIEWKEKCRQFARESIAPFAEAYDKLADFPEKAHDQAAAQGFLHLAFSEELGGRGVGELDLALAVEEMAACCAGSALALNLNHVALQPVLSAGTLAQQKKFAARLLARRGYAGLACDPLRGAGSLAVRALRGEEGWVLSSLEPVPVPNGTKAELFVVLAQVQGEGPTGPTFFAVPRADGVVLEPSGERLGFRCLTTPRLLLSSVELDDDSVLGPVGGAASVLATAQEPLRFLLAATHLGLAVGAVREGMDWLQREASGLLELREVQLKLADLYRGVRECRLQIWRTARMLEHGVEAGAEVASAALHANALARSATEAALGFYARAGRDADLRAQKRFRDARVFSLPGGVPDALRLGLYARLRDEVERDGLL